MKKSTTTLLRIDASIRTGDSYSRQLADHFERCWLDRNPGAHVIRRDLAKDPPPHLDEAARRAFFAGDRDLPALRHSNDLIDEIKGCDALLIATPVYNFHVPSSLKAYIDLVVRPGETFAYGNGDGDSRGLLGGLPVYSIIAQGGRLEGPTDPGVVGTYLSGICRYIGLGEPVCFTIDGTSEATFASEKLRTLQREVDRVLS